VRAGVVAVVPVKGLANAKSRLAPRLASEERTRLVLRLLDNVLSAIQHSASIEHCLVVSPDPVVLEHASARGMVALDEGSRERPPFDPPARGGKDDVSYNRALELAREAAMARWNPAALLVLAADLPWIGAADVADLVALGAQPGTVVIAPDRHGVGTNALLLRPPAAIPFRFGPDSHQRHCQEALARGLRVQFYRDSGTAMDVDLPDDLAAVLA